MLQLAIALALMSGSGSDDGPRRDSNFVLHEWGTFTTVAGSNGVQIGELTYDEESLPASSTNATIRSGASSM